jgi:hypothetical protein
MDSSRTRSALVVNDDGEHEKFLSVLLEQSGLPRPPRSTASTVWGRRVDTLPTESDGGRARECAIAGWLFISARPVEPHRANVMRKLGLRSQTDVVRYALRRGIPPPDVRPALFDSFLRVAG